jgi:hypothetical protein
MNVRIFFVWNRVANRITNGEFKLNDKVYKLEKNNGQSCLHGGSHGLCNVNNFELFLMTCFKTVSICVFPCYILIPLNDYLG